MPPAPYFAFTKLAGVWHTVAGADLLHGRRLLRIGRGRRRRFTASQLADAATFPDAVKARRALSDLAPGHRVYTDSASSTPAAAIASR